MFYIDFIMDLVLVLGSCACLEGERSIAPNIISPDIVVFAHQSVFD
jgi:hypothetical protein